MRLEATLGANRAVSCRMTPCSLALRCQVLERSLLTSASGFKTAVKCLRNLHGVTFRSTGCNTLFTKPVIKFPKTVIKVSNMMLRFQTIILMKMKPLSTCPPYHPYLPFPGKCPIVLCFVSSIHSLDSASLCIQ
jgi:hypothetical protein